MKDTPKYTRLLLSPLTPTGRPRTSCLGGMDSERTVEETTEVAAESATPLSDSNTNCPQWTRKVGWRKRF